MPRVQYSHPCRNINVCKPMPTPKCVGDLQAWVKAAGKVHPNAPIKWTISHKLVTDRLIVLEFVSREGEKFALVIDRKAETICG